MELPVIIQEFPEGYVVEIPESELALLLEQSSPMSKEEAFSFVQRSAKQLNYDIPEHWKKPVKRYKGFIAGVDVHVAAEGDDIVEVMGKLVEEAKGLSELLKTKAKQDWSAPNIIHATIYIP